MLHDRTVAQHVEHGIIDTIRPGTHRRQQPTPPHTGVQGRGINAFFRQYVEQQTVAQLKLLHDRRGQFGGIVVAAFHKQRGLVLVHGDFGRGGPRVDHKNAKHADLTGN